MEVCGCEISTADGNLMIFSIYIPPSVAFDKNNLNILNAFAGNTPALFCGDFNAHNEVWGSRNTSNRGRDILDFIESEELVLLNTGEFTHLGSEPSCIDLTFGSASLGINSFWRVARESLGSDHCIIEITIFSQPCKRVVAVNSVPKGIDKCLLNDKIGELINSTAFINDHKSFFDKLSNEFIKTFGKKNKKAKIRNPTPWWNAECNKISAELRRAVANSTYNPSRENFDVLIAIRKTYKYVLRREKRLGWQKFCSNIDSNMTISELWQTVRCFKGSYSDGMSGFVECVEKFCDNLSGASGPINDPSISLFRAMNDDHLTLKPITYSELDNAISMSKDTAPGIDGIRNGHLKLLSTNIKFRILQEFNQILTSGNIPPCWFEYKVIPLRKKNCPATEASSYRSIAMASTLRKIFERILCWRLEWFLESQELLSSQQSGFRRSKSTTDNVIALWSAVSLAFAEGKSLCVAFLDIKGAFDNVSIVTLCTLLHNMGTPSKLCNIIYSLFRYKNLKVTHGDDITERRSYMGVPQGCVLSPLCFNVYINNVFCSLPQDVHILGYADDIAVFCTDFDPYIARNKIQTAINLISQTLQKLQLSLSVNKTKAMLFSKQRHIHLIPPIIIDGNNVDFTDNFNFLGFIFNKRLSLQNHVQYTVKRCFKFVNVIRSLCAVSWGSDPSCLIQLYVGLIRPKLEYMAPLLLQCNGNDLLKLQRIQWKCLRAALGAMQSTHTLSLEQMSNVMPLPERFRLITNGVLEKILTDNKHPARQFLSKLVDNQVQSEMVRLFRDKISNFNIHSNNLHPTYSQHYESLVLKPVVKYLPVKKSSTTSSEVCSLFHTYTHSKWKNFTRIFTDGSKTVGAVGSGVWYPDINIEAYFPLHPLSSVFSAEATAIIEAIKLIKCQKDGKFLIVSDSRSVLTAITSFPKGSTHTYIFMIRSLLYDLKQQNISVHFLWVPSHMGIEGNEYVDNIASTHIHNGNECKILAKDLRCVDRSTALSSWQHRWNDSEFGRHLYNIAPKINKNPWYKNSKFSREKITMINRLKFNHTRCKDHIFKINIISDNVCSCGETQTANHLLFHCSEGDQSSRLALVNYLNNYNYSNLHLSELLKLNNLSIFSLIYNFFKKSNFKI